MLSLRQRCLAVASLSKRQARYYFLKMLLTRVHFNRADWGLWRYTPPQPSPWQGEGARQRGWGITVLHQLEICCKWNQRKGILADGVTKRLKVIGLETRLSYPKSILKKEISQL